MISERGFRGLQTGIVLKNRSVTYSYNFTVPWVEKTSACVQGLMNQYPELPKALRSW